MDQTHFHPLPDCYIDVPDNGIIEDWAPWNTGLALVRARHMYERLWESVVLYNNVMVAQFQVPANPQYFVRRILGISNGENWGPVLIGFPYNQYNIIRNAVNNDNDIHQYIRPFAAVSLHNIQHLTGWLQSLNLANQVRPPAYPLLPPIRWKNKNYYLPHKEEVLKADKVKHL